MIVRVKICGITRSEDARAAVDLGADAVGFVFFPGSKRAVTPEHAAKIVATLPPFVTPVGVFVDAPAEEMLKTAETSGVRCLQLHGNESPEILNRLRLPFIKAFRTSGEFDPSVVSRFRAAAVMIDGYSEDGYGGTGTRADWDKAAKAGRYAPLILSGGLRAENVADAIRGVHPYAVDVSSGVELSPGVKDPRLIAAFMRAVRSAESAAEGRPP